MPGEEQVGAVARAGAGAGAGSEVKTNAKALSLLSSSGDDISLDKINHAKVNSNN